ncbi:MAG: ribonuclease HII, partial [Clostridia bacterium]|nr:ribonuclease HII [Clostridia bacterium]
MLNYDIEQEQIDKGFKLVCGVDEAGRGPLCGPVVAAAVILPCGLYIEGLDDSKKLTEKKREKLYDIICESAIAYSIMQSTVEQINETNILEATQSAMRRAVEALSPNADFAL